MAKPKALHREPCHIHPRSTSGGNCRLCQELSALRLYRCARCNQKALICSGCDRGQIYCAKGCADQARRESLHRAGATYQNTFQGRRKHAARQEQYRREKQKVTHQGPPPPNHFLFLGPAANSHMPAQEESDVPTRAVSPSPMGSVPPVEAQACPWAPVPPQAALRASPEVLVCHFCRCTQSQYLRRDTLCHLRRTKRHRRPARSDKGEAG